MRVVGNDVVSILLNIETLVDEVPTSVEDFHRITKTIILRWDYFVFNPLVGQRRGSFIPSLLDGIEDDLAALVEFLLLLEFSRLLLGFFMFHVCVWIDK